MATYTPAPKDPDTAFLIEIAGGFFGFLGLGYFYTGRTNDGLIRLIIWWVYLGVSYVIITVLSLAGFIGLLCCIPQLAIQICLPFWSANSLKKSMISSISTGTPRPGLASGAAASPAPPAPAAKPDTGPDAPQKPPAGDE